MATSIVNFRLDDNDKKGMEMVCDALGLSMSAAFTIFAKKVSREKRIPFDLSIDPFYSEDNFKRLSKAVEDVNAGRNTSEHELIEVD